MCGIKNFDDFFFNFIYLNFFINLQCKNTPYHFKIQIQKSKIYFSPGDPFFLCSKIVFHFDTNLGEKPECFDDTVLPMGATSESNDSIVNMYILCVSLEFRYHSKQK